jgi:hypothetical protein
MAFNLVILSKGFRGFGYRIGLWLITLLVCLLLQAVTIFLENLIGMPPWLDLRPKTRVFVENYTQTPWPGQG